jgi:hypothetical protein
MTAHQLQALLVNRLIRAHGGGSRAWRAAVGPVRVYDVATHPHCNWAVMPSGSIGENAAVERLCDSVRAEHPIISR